MLQDPTTDISLISRVVHDNLFPVSMSHATKLYRLNHIKDSKTLHVVHFDVSSKISD